LRPPPALRASVSHRMMSSFTNLESTLGASACVSQRCSQRRNDEDPRNDDPFLHKCRLERSAVGQAQVVPGLSSAAQVVQRWIQCRYVLGDNTLALEYCTEGFEMDRFGDKCGPDRQQILEQWRKEDILPTPTIPMKSKHGMVLGVRFPTTIIEPDATWKVHHIRNIHVPWDDRPVFACFEWIVIKRDDRMLISQYTERFTNRTDLSIF